MDFGLKNNNIFRIDNVNAMVKITQFIYLKNFTFLFFN